MSLTPGSVSEQIDTAHNSLAAYFSALRKFVLDPTGATLPPDFGDSIDDLDYSELLTMTAARFSDSASYENGAAIENIHHMAAITREFELRGKGKLEYYADAANGYLSESNYYSTMDIFWINMINNNYVEGATS